MEPEQEMFSNEESRKRDEAVRSFVEMLNEKSVDELTGIITRYIEYQPDTVEAAMFLLVEKGIISYELKEKLLKQIDSNFADHSKRYKQYKWESNNAFIQFVSRYQDDEIYNFIEDPKGIVIDVYHAILVTAMERQLISEKDFTEYYVSAKAVPKTDAELRNEIVDEFITESFTGNEVVSEAELESEIEKYWKCPSCGEMVGMEFGVCWKCQTEIPETIVHPGKEEVIKEIRIRKSFSPVKTGLFIIVCGIGIDLLTLARGYSLDDFWHFRYIEFVLGIIFTLAGLGFVIFGLFFYSKEKPDTSK